MIPEKTEEQGYKDGGEREKIQTSFAVLDICVAGKAIHSHAAAAAAQARRAGEGEAAGWSDQTIVP